MILFLIAFNALITACAQIVLKLGINRIGGFQTSEGIQFFLKAATSPYVIGGTILYVISLGLWLVVLSKANVSYAYPIMGLSYVFGIILAMLVLDEKVVVWQWLGSACIILGVYFVTKS